MMTTICPRVVRRIAAGKAAVATQISRWTRPLTHTLIGGALADATKTKPALLAENALLRQQLIVLRRQSIRA